MQLGCKPRNTCLQVHTPLDIARTHATLSGLPSYQVWPWGRTGGAGPHIGRPCTDAHTHMQSVPEHMHTFP